MSFVSTTPHANKHTHTHYMKQNPVGPACHVTNVLPIVLIHQAVDGVLTEGQMRRGVREILIAFACNILQSTANLSRYRLERKTVLDQLIQRGVLRKAHMLPA